MNRLNRSNYYRLMYGFYFLTASIGLALFAGCVAPVVRQPTLAEARMGQGVPQGDMTLAPGEIRGEVTDVAPARHEIHVRTDDGRMAAIVYDPVYTRVSYHGWNYSVTDLESGDVIAFHTVYPAGRSIDMIRVQEPVQARAAAPVVAQRPPPPMSDVIEGTVVRVDYDLGMFEVRPRGGGRPVTVTVPYNASGADVDSFRRLRTGDYVRLEGQFFNADSFQLMAFLSGSDVVPPRR